MKRSQDKKRARSGNAVKSADGILYPYSRQDVSDFFGRHPSFRIAYLKIERSIDDFGHAICEIILKAEGERLILQGIEFLRNRFRYPPHLDAVPAEVRKALERQVIHRLLETRVTETPLSEQELSYTGERVVPATAPFHAYWMHARRYGFAAKRCRGKRVLDVGCGSGYGTRILGVEAVECLGVDRDPEAVRLAGSLFAGPRVAFAVGDATQLTFLPDQAFDGLVALEFLEHLPPESIPAFMAEARRLVTPGGTFVISVANRVHRDREDNPFHLSEMSFEEFKALIETRFGVSGIEFFGQDVWGGTWRLDRECRIEPIHGPTSDHVYLAVARSDRSG